MPGESGPGSNGNEEELQISKAQASQSDGLMSHLRYMFDLVGYLCLWRINLCRLFNTKCIFKKTVLFQAIQFSLEVLIQLNQFSISTDFVYKQLKNKTVLY